MTNRTQTHATFVLEREYPVSVDRVWAPSPISTPSASGSGAMPSTTSSAATTSGLVA
jgi:hypothetical protein